MQIALIVAENVAKESEQKCVFMKSDRKMLRMITLASVTTCLPRDTAFRFGKGQGGREICFKKELLANQLAMRSCSSLSPK